ncbi:hypothetical protein DV737_g2362, partial [Chaetothyriales sp. CBS 132003]
MAAYTLHGDPISGNTYKILLTASLLSIPLEYRKYSTLKGETRTPAFLSTISSYGRIPVLEIRPSTYLPESNAICYYLADTGPSNTLIPSDPLLRADMLKWMFFEQNQHEVNVATLRFWLKFVGVDNLSAERKAQINDKRERGADALGYLNDQLAKSQSGWLVGDSVTLADVCLFAYTHTAEEGGFDLSRLPAVKSWLQKVTELEGFVPM